jgi:hypothetical protein
VTRGVERSGQGAAVEDAGGAAAARSMASLAALQIERAATPQVRHDHEHRTERVVARRGLPWAAAFRNPARTPKARICRAEDCCFAAGLDMGPVLGCLRQLENRVPLASSTIADLSRRSMQCATAAAHAHRSPTGRRIAWRERHGGLFRSHLQIRCENRAIEFSYTTRARMTSLGHRSSS